MPFVGHVVGVVAPLIRSGRKAPKIRNWFDWRLILMFGAASYAPDFDILLNIPLNWAGCRLPPFFDHRGWTHGLLGILILGYLFWLISERLRLKIQYWVFTLLVAAHIALDLLFDNGFPAGDSLASVIRWVFCPGCSVPAFHHQSAAAGLANGVTNIFHHIQVEFTNFWVLCLTAVFAVAGFIWRSKFARS